MQYSPTAPLLPHCCFMCNNGSGPFVDLGRDDEDPREAGKAGVQFGGVYHLYLCVTCAMNLAQVVERDSPNAIISRHHLSEMEADYNAATARCAILEQENADLRVALGVHRVYGAIPDDLARPQPVTADRVSTPKPAPRKARTV